MSKRKTSVDYAPATGLREINGLDYEVVEQQRILGGVCRHFIGVSASRSALLRIPIQYRSHHVPAGG